MSETTGTTVGMTAQEPSAKTPIMPNTTLGRWAIILGVFSILAMFVILPLVTMAYRDVAPITDSWVMPVIGLVLVDIAAAMGVVAFWRKGERSLISIVGLVIMLPAGLFVTFMVVGEAIGSALGITE